jgi:hypothetical protein
MVLKNLYCIKLLVALLVLVFVMPGSVAYSQRIIRELESNAGNDFMRGMEGDSIASNRDNEDEDEDFVPPVEIRAWTIDRKYGNILPTYVDTLHHQYQNNNLSEGMNGHFNHLGNLGSPRINRIFMERKDEHQFMFLNPMDQFFVETDQFRFYNTKSPFMNVAYNTCGNKTTGDDHVKVTFARNVGKNFNFGGIFDYMYGQGYYNSQSTSHMNASAFGSYTADRYNLHFYYQHNYMKLAENGGIEDEKYITRPEDLSQKYNSSDIPTLLTRTWNKQEHDVLYLNHKYNMGFMREASDTIDTMEVFVPVANVFHTFKLERLTRGFISYDMPENYNEKTYLLPSDSVNDRTKNFSVKNLLGLSLCEGFNKWAAAGLSAYVGYEYRNFILPDKISADRFDVYNRKYTEHNVLVGGQLVRTQGKAVHYNVDAELVVAGEDVGAFNVVGRGELNFPFLKDTAQLVVNAYVKNKAPGFYYRHYHSKHAWWDREYDKEFRTRIEGQVSIPRTRTKITVGVENIKNFVYFQGGGSAYAASDGRNAFHHSVAPVQCGDNVQVISANLRQDFKLGIFHLDNDVTFQTTTMEDVIPVPKLSLYHNLYLKFRIAKVLACELGGDLKYFTEYYAPDYSPIIGQFCNQNPNNKVEIGNYPLLSAYVNFDLKRTRFYVQYYHANQSDGRYFWAPGYPMNPGGLHFGLSWNFYD